MDIIKTRGVEEWGWGNPLILWFHKFNGQPKHCWPMTITPGYRRHHFISKMLNVFFMINWKIVFSQGGRYGGSCGVGPLRGRLTACPPSGNLGNYVGILKWIIWMMILMYLCFVYYSYYNHQWHYNTHVYLVKLVLGRQIILVGQLL